jgi:hypothetical protein
MGCYRCLGFTPPISFPTRPHSRSGPRRPDLLAVESRPQRCSFWLPPSFLTSGRAQGLAPVKLTLAAATQCHGATCRRVWAQVQILSHRSVLSGRFMCLIACLVRLHQQMGLVPHLICSCCDSSLLCLSIFASIWWLLGCAREVLNEMCVKRREL